MSPLARWTIAIGALALLALFLGLGVYLVTTEPCLPGDDSVRCRP